MEDTFSNFTLYDKEVNKNNKKTSLSKPEYSIADYQGKYALPDDKPLAIRLIQIQPRAKDVGPMSSPIKLRMRLVDLDPRSQLLPGESALPPWRPTVRFDEEMSMERPDERFGIPRSAVPTSSGHRQPAPPSPVPPEKSSRGLRRLVAKLTAAKTEMTSPDLTMVSLCEIPEGELKVRNRFWWGNYVAMSYSWGKLEAWEMTDDEREAARKAAAEKEEQEREKERKNPAHKRPPSDDNDVDGTFHDGDVHFVVLDRRRIRVQYNL